MQLIGGMSEVRQSGVYFSAVFSHGSECSPDIHIDDPLLLQSSVPWLHYLLHHGCYRGDVVCGEARGFARWGAQNLRRRRRSVGHRTNPPLLLAQPSKHAVVLAEQVGGTAVAEQAGQ